MDLIERCRTGDGAAFGELFEQYKNLVYRSAYLMLGDAGEAEELLQDVFEKLLHSLSSYQPEKSAFTTWLHRVTINACLNRRRRRTLFEWFQNRERFEPPAVWEPHPAGDDGDKQCVNLAVRRLSDTLRAVIILRYYHGLSYAETAYALKITVGTVKSRLNLAHKRLREDLKDDFQEYPLQQEVSDELPTG
jgi:RNA polymerase sigma-70 factor, ECF subfamily